MAASRTATALVGATLMVVAAAGCSDSAPSAGQFVGAIDNICNSLGDQLDTLDKPATTDDVQGFASDASGMFLDAVTALKKLTVPSASSQVSDAKSLVGKLDHLVDVLDDIAGAARSGDTSTLGNKTDEFESVRGEISDLADSLDAKHCDLDAQFDELAPPVTEPPVTNPPVTTPADGATKQHATIAASLVPAGNYSFTDVSDDLLDSWATLVNTSPDGAAAAGTVAGVEVTINGTLVGRVFVFIAETAQPATISLEIATAINGTVSPDTVNGFPGYSWTTSDNLVAFTGAQQAGSAKFFMYAVSPSRDGVEAIVTAVWESLPN